MKKVFCLITLLSFCVIFVSCASTEKKLQDSGAKLLNQQDLIELFKVELVGKAQSSRGSSDLYYFPDRTQKVEYGSGSDEGKYRIENGQLCSKWKEIRGGAEKCQRIYHIEGNKYQFVYLDGSDAGLVTFKK